MRTYAVMLAAAVVTFASCVKQSAEPALVEADVRRIIADVVGKSEKETLERAKQLTEHHIATIRDEVKKAIELESLRRSSDFAKLNAVEAKNNLQHDLDLAAVLDGRELLMFMNIAEKRKAGEVLTDDELRLAFQFNEFQEYIRPAIDERAKRRGLTPTEGK